MTYNRTQRRRFTDLQRVQFFNDHHGVCWLCNRKIDGVHEKWEIEHMIARELMGDGADDDSNLALAHVSCHKAKTAEDRRAIAKSNSVQARHMGAHRAKAKIHSAGFNRPSSNARDIWDDLPEADRPCKSDRRAAETETP